MPPEKACGTSKMDGKVLLVSLDSCGNKNIHRKSSLFMDQIQSRETVKICLELSMSELKFTDVDEIRVEVKK